MDDTPTLDLLLQIIGLAFALWIFSAVFSYLVKEMKLLVASLKKELQPDQVDETLVTIPPDVRMAMAAHEAGHALLTYLAGYDIHRIHIRNTRKASKPANGFVEYTRPTTASRRNLTSTLEVYLAGHAAERILIGATTNGAHGDMGEALALANEMVRTHGYGTRTKGLPMFHHDNIPQPIFDMMEDDVAEILFKARETVDKAITAHVSAVRALAEVIFQDSTVTAEDVLKIFALHEVVPGVPEGPLNFGGGQADGEAVCIADEIAA